MMMTETNERTNSSSLRSFHSELEYVFFKFFGRGLRCDEKISKKVEALRKSYNTGIRGIDNFYRAIFPILEHCILRLCTMYDFHNATDTLKF